MGGTRARVHYRDRGPQVQPEEAGGEMMLGSQWVPEPPAPTVPAHHDPSPRAGQGPGRDRLGPAVHVQSGRCVQISKKKGCGAAAPASPTPPQTGSRSRGRGSGSIALPIMHGGGWARGKRKKAELGCELSQSPCPLPPWRLCWQDSEARGGPGMASPLWGQAVPHQSWLFLEAEPRTRAIRPPGRPYSSLCFQR